VKETDAALPELPAPAAAPPVPPGPGPGTGAAGWFSGAEPPPPGTGAVRPDRAAWGAAAATAATNAVDAGDELAELASRPVAHSPAGALPSSDSPQPEADLTAVLLCVARRRPWARARDISGGSAAISGAADAAEAVVVAPGAGCAAGAAVSAGVEGWRSVEPSLLPACSTLTLSVIGSSPPGAGSPVGGASLPAAFSSAAFRSAAAFSSAASFC
jgi:hypothetical protein